MLKVKDQLQFIKFEKKLVHCAYIVWSNIFGHQNKVTFSVMKLNVPENQHVTVSDGICSENSSP